MVIAWNPFEFPLPAIGEKVWVNGSNENRQVDVPGIILKESTYEAYIADRILSAPAPPSWKFYEVSID